MAAPICVPYHRRQAGRADVSSVRHTCNKSDPAVIGVQTISSSSNLFVLNIV